MFFLCFWETKPFFKFKIGRKLKVFFHFLCKNVANVAMFQTFLFTINRFRELKRLIDFTVLTYFTFILDPVKLSQYQIPGQYFYWLNHCLTLTLFRMGGQKSPTTSFSPATSTNVRIRPQNFLTFSFSPCDRLV